MTATSVSMIGYGRMGKVLTDILSDDFSISVYDIQLSSKESEKNISFTDLETALQSKTIFIAVPIRAFESVIKEIASRIFPETAIIDLCSVKVYPAKIMKKYLPKNDLIAAHPLFGPDSAHLSPLKIMMHSLQDSSSGYTYWNSYFKKKNFTVIEMTPEEHDQTMAHSQVITHFIGRAIKEAEIKSTALDTASFKKLLEVSDQVTHDSKELFYDLLNYNPYTKEAINKLKQAFTTIETGIVA